MNTNQNQTRSWPLRAAALLLACALCACLGLRVAAQTGSITVTMRTDDSEASTPVPGGTLTAYLVAVPVESTNAESGLEYTFSENFKALGDSVTLPTAQKEENLNNAADLAAQLSTYVQEQGIKGTTVTIDADGVASFDDLENGLYLLTQDTAPDGYQTLQPFLIEVPTMQENGLLYDLQAYPKLAVLSDTNTDVPWWLPLLGLAGLPFIIGNTSTETGTVAQLPAAVEVPAPEKESTGEGSVAEEAANAHLPQTGQLNWPVPVLTLAGLTLVLLGFALRRSGKEEE
jgi:hypothetical protein